MKKMNFIHFSLFLGLLFAAFSCKQAPVQETISGKVIDATMNNISLLTEAGDTVNISKMDTDPAKVPGVLIDDSVDITYVKQKAGDSEVLQAVELTITAHSPYFYIAGTWVQPNPINAEEVQGFTLVEDGTASSVNMATLVFKNWVLNNSSLILTSESIGNKQTIVSSDTLQVIKLDADSLVLGQKGNIVWQLGRQK